MAHIFINSQIRILDTLVDVTQAGSSLLEDNCVSQNVLVKVNERVNAAIRTHNRAVYPIEGTGRIADKIDAEWYLRLARAHVTGEDADETLNPLVDQHFESLPTEWPSTRSRVSWLEDYADAKRYDQLYATLLELKETRAKRQATVDMLGQLVERTKCLEDPMKTMQAQLGTRDGELAQEIARMKRLLAQVSTSKSQS